MDSDYITGIWHVLESDCIEYLFPPESCAWVLEPDGTLTEYGRSHIQFKPRFLIATSHFISDDELDNSGVFTLNLNARFWIHSKKAFYTLGKTHIYYRTLRSVFERIR